MLGVMGTSRVGGNSGEVRREMGRCMVRVGGWIVCLREVVGWRFLEGRV